MTIFTSCKLHGKNGNGNCPGCRQAQTAAILQAKLKEMSPGMKATLERAKRVRLANGLPGVPAMPVPKCLHGNPWNKCQECK